MLSRELADVGAQALARAQAAEDLAHHLLSHGVVADERDAPVGALAASGRLGDVVEEGAEAQGLAALELVGQRLGEDGFDPRRQLAEDGAEIRFQLDQPSQDLDRVVVHVEMVEMALLDTAEGGQLGEHGVQHFQPRGKLEPREAARGDDQPAELRERALG